jgi:hypothetical protein
MHRFVKDLTVWTIALGIGAAPAASWAEKEGDGHGRDKNACEKTARLARGSCRSASSADLELETGKCVQSLQNGELRECKADALDAFREGNGECREQQEARIDLCRALDEGLYAPELDPADFVATIDNPFAPFGPGAHWVYEKEGEDGLERIEVDVLAETKTILGITATVVRDREFLDGELIEDTRDWLAQDSDGNVWYLGELSYEVEDGVIVSLSGSWEAGVDGAQPGLWMKADPQVGDVYRQELLLGEAEDYAEVLSLTDSQTVPAGSFTNCLRTRDASPLEPGNEENKVYAPGVGLVVEIDPESGERAELIEFDLP